MSLGAGRTVVLGSVLAQGVRLSSVGLVIGLLGSMAASRLLSGLLFDVQAIDPLTLLGVAGGLAVVAVTACLIPAYRAGKVDPLVALRCE